MDQRSSPEKGVSTDPFWCGGSDKSAPVLLPEQEDYAIFADRLLRTCLVNDAWHQGKPIYRSAPMVLPQRFSARLFAAGERIGRLYDELCDIVRQDDSLLDSFYGLLPYYKLMWLASDGWWHGFARMDMFELEDGSLKICELNADTPTGQVEALVPGSLVAPQYPQLQNPNEEYEERFWQMLLSVHRARTGGESAPQAVGIIYPTDLPEDITLIRLYQRWLEKRGVNAPLGSPYNIQRRPDGGLGLFDQPVDMILRHYKTDWWGERPGIFEDDEPVMDPDPLEVETRLILDAERRGLVSVVNPFGALIPQNKLSLAFFWEEQHRFSAESQKTIQDLIPETRRLDGMDWETLKKERSQWVLKTDFGCEGDEVLLGPYLDDETWADSIDTAMKHTWVAQRFFHTKPIEETWLPNYGVYLIAGAASGLLVRISPAGEGQDEDARVVVPLVFPEPTSTSTHSRGMNPRHDPR